LLSPPTIFPGSLLPGWGGFIAGMPAEDSRHSQGGCDDNNPYSVHAHHTSHLVVDVVYLLVISNMSTRIQKMQAIEAAIPSQTVLVTNPVQAVKAIEETMSALKVLFTIKCYFLPVGFRLTNRYKLYNLILLTSMSVICYNLTGKGKIYAEPERAIL
jgi:hypothetical protein